MGRQVAVMKLAAGDHYRRVIVRHGVAQTETVLVLGLTVDAPGVVTLHALVSVGGLVEEVARDYPREFVMTFSDGA